jgi:hypothetical protein
LLLFYRFVVVFVVSFCCFVEYFADGSKEELKKLRVVPVSARDAQLHLSEDGRSVRLVAGPLGPVPEHRTVQHEVSLSGNVSADMLVRLQNTLQQHCAVALVGSKELHACSLIVLLKQNVTTMTWNLEDDVIARKALHVIENSLSK